MYSFRYEVLLVCEGNMNTSKCEHCGASLNQRWDRITAGEVEFLIRFRDLIIANNKNLVNVPHEMKLSNVEYSDFQKLRYHALIAKYKEDGKCKRGWWVLTHRGNLFIKGELKIAEKVRIFRNRITGYSEELVTAAQVLETDPYWDNQDTIVFEGAGQDVIDDSKAEVIKKKRKKNDNKTYCKCGGVMKKGFDMEENDDGSVRVKNYMKCIQCGDVVIIS